MERDERSGSCRGEEGVGGIEGFEDAEVLGCKGFALGVPVGIGKKRLQLGEGEFGTGALLLLDAARLLPTGDDRAAKFPWECAAVVLTGEVVVEVVG